MPNGNWPCELSCSFPYVLCVFLVFILFTYLHVFYFFSSFHSPPFFLIFIFFFLRRSVRPSIPRSVGLSVHPLRLCKYRVSRLYLATFRSYTNSNARRTCFQSLFCPFVVHLSVRLSVSPYSCHVVSAKFNIRGDIVRTHRCPVGLVPLNLRLTLL